MFAWLIETGFNEHGRNLGRVYDEPTDELFDEILVVSIAARGYWVEPTSDRPDLIERLTSRLADVSGP